MVNSAMLCTGSDKYDIYHINGYGVIVAIEVRISPIFLLHLIEQAVPSPYTISKMGIVYHRIYNQPQRYQKKIRRYYVYEILW